MPFTPFQTNVLPSFWKRRVSRTSRFPFAKISSLATYASKRSSFPWGRPSNDPLSAKSKCQQGARYRVRLGWQVFDPRSSSTPLRCIELQQRASGISIYFQIFMITVLFPGSQELWRISGGERPNSASPPFRQSGAFREEARKYWVFLPLKFGGERFARGPNGGGRGSGIQPSLLVKY